MINIFVEKKWINMCCCTAQCNNNYIVRVGTSLFVFVAVKVWTLVYIRLDIIYGQQTESVFRLFILFFFCFFFRTPF